MNFKEYSEQAKRTFKSLVTIDNPRETLKKDLSHMALGMVSELSELQIALRNSDQTNIMEELGDICWYLINTSDLLGIDFGAIAYEEYKNKVSNIFNHNIQGLTDFEKLCFLISEVSNLVKRFLAYDKDYELETFKVLLYGIYLKVDDVADFWLINFDIILQKNIQKLAIRYPEKFTEYHALNRDLDSEYKTLSNE